MISALIMWRRLKRTIEYALREEDFANILGAGVFLVLTGTLAYSLGEDWNVVDGLYFAVATLTTSSVADPDLVLQHDWLKLFTVFYVLIGIGILVEVARRLGVAFIEIRHRDKAAKAAKATR